jgi:hypothetical protein
MASLGKFQLQFFKTDEKNTVLVKMWNLKKNKPYNNGRYNLAATVKPVLSVEDNTFFGFLINSKEFKVTHRNLDGSIDWVEAKSWAIDYSMNDETKKEEMSFLDGGFGRC